MKTLFSFLIGISFCLTTSPTIGQNIEWATGIVTHAYGELGLAVLPDGNSIICGTYLDSCVIDNNLVIGYSVNSYPYSGVFLAKLNTSGNLVWVTSIADSSNVKAYNVTCDKEGNIYLAGHSGVVNEGSFSMTEAGAFIAKYSPSGSLIWVKPAVSTGISDFTFQHTVVSDAGSIYVAGQLPSNHQIDIGCGQTLESNGGSYKFIVKYDQTGVCQWYQTFRATYLHNIDVDSDDNLFLTGSFVDESNFGSISYTCSGQQDIYLAKCNSSGSWDWAIKAGSGSMDIGNAVAVAADGRAFITGYFQDTITFGCDELISSGTSDIFLACLDVSGNCLWSKQMGGGRGNQYGFGLAVDQLGNCVVTGTIIDTTTFDEITVIPNGQKAYYAKYDTAGNCNWAYCVDDRPSSGSGGIGLGIDNADNIYSVGRLTSYGSFSFGDHVVEIPNVTAGPFPYIGGKYLMKINSPPTDDIQTPNVNVYPNPTSDAVNIEFSSEENSVLMNLFDARGALLHSNQWFEVKFLNYRLPKTGGLYLMHFVLTDGTQTTVKVVKE